MEKLDIIQPSEILIRKKDGSWRFCVDYRRLNKITKKDVYPLPRIDDTLDCLRGARFYSSMDLQSGYWQIDVEESDREKTAFITPDGLYEIKVMPFGLCNAPATFERMIDNLLKGLKWTICLCYLDDIIVFSDGFEEHLRRLQLVLNCLKKAGLCLNSKKCKFGAKNIMVLGHEVSENGIRPDQEKIRAVRDFATPRSLKEVRSFLGLSSYYRRFIPNYAHVAQPLNDLLKKDSAFNWNQEEQNAFEALKSALISEPALGHFDYSSPTEIHTDASNYGIGAVLVQIQKGKERAIAYASRTLNKAEKNYSTTEMECLAIIWAINKFRPYVFGQPFTIVTDHHSLCWLTNLKDPWHLQPIPVPEVGMDLLGRFPTSEGGNRWIIVCTDYLTKYAITKALPTSESMEVAKFFIEDVILKHGAPRELITDRGRNFTSSMISDLNNQCRITHRKTTAYHPQTNGLTERLNKTIEDMLSMYVDVNQKDWDRILPFSTGFTPFFLVHGREAETPLDVLFPKLLPEDDDFIQTLGARAEEARKLARIHSMRSQDSNKQRYDAHHRNIIYQPGDLVWIFIPVRKVGYSVKLMRRYFGPYKVTRKISDVTYEVDNNFVTTVFICRMKPYLNPEDQEDHLEEDPEDDSTNFQEEDIPTERTQQPQTRVEISGPITRSRALRLRIAKTWLNLHKISFTSWENFKRRLIEDFASDANKEEMKMRLNRMQQWNEPAIRFAEDILVLCNKVDPQMEEETKINWIFRVGRFKLSVAPDSFNQSKSTINGIRKLDPRYKININVDKIGLCEALIDTGADLSVVDLRTALFAGREINSLTKTCSGPDGKKLDMVGSIILDLKIDDTELSHEFVVMDAHLRTLILGRDFLKKMNAKIDCKRETIKYNLMSNHDVSNYDLKKIKSTTDTVIPKLSIKLIRASIEAEDGEYVIEENNKMTQTNGLRLARSLLTVTDKKTHIWITNPYPRPLKIMKDQTLAYGSLPAEVNFIENIEKQNENDEIQFQINKNLSFKEQERLKQILAKYTDLFSSRLGRTNLAKHQIHTEDAKPIKHKPYRVSAKERTIIKDQIDEMLEEGIIRPSSSPWSFPVILVKKRDGKYRFCVDYRKLNEVTVKDVYPIPRIDDVMDSLQGSKYFSAIDLKSGYWQVEIEERDKEKTAFTTAHGLYEFNVMPFGLCNAPATFERNMENMLGNLRWQICLCYLDDVIIYSPDFPTHLKRLEAVFRCFRESNLILNDKKCRFVFEELEILGYITSKHGIKPAEHNIKAIRNFPRPTKVKEVQSFLGMCSYYRKFIKDFSKIADPLTNLIKKSVSFTWTERQEEAFQTLKTALLSPPILGHFNPNAPTYIHTDASNIGIGATLVQDIGGEEKVISYLSRTLSKAEQNYSTTEKECLAVVWSMSKLRPHLYGRHFKIPIPPANFPFERIGIDFVGPLPSTKNRKKWIIVLTDYYTRYAETRAVSEVTVKEVSKFLVEDIFLRHGAPQYLISDRGSQFTSNLMKEVMKTCKIKHCFTTSYHPQTNGLTERLNRTLINMLSMYVNTDQKNWDEILPFITHAYNTTIQETTGYSPFFLMFGREPTSLLDDRNISVDIDKDDYDEYIKHHLDKINRTRKLVINNTIKTQERMKKNYDKKHMERSYEPGELVAVWTPIRKIGKCEKLLRKYFGPYRILKKLSNVNYLIEPKDNPGQDPLIVHVSRIKPYFERIDEGEAAGVKNPPSSTAAKLQQNYVEIIIDDIAFSALVDSGSSFSVISDGLRRQLKKTMFKDSGMTLKVADGKNVTSIGRCTISLSINGLEQPLEFIVLPNSNPSIILGWDFLEASNAVIDCGRAEIRLEEAKDVLNSPASMGKVVASRSVVIPAESTKLINVMSEELNGQNQVLFEPSKKVLIGKGLTLPCALFRLSHNKGKLWIVNSSTTAQIVPKGMCLGKIQRVEENNLTAISECSEFNKEVKNANHASHADKSDFKFLQNLISDDLSEEQQSQILSILKRYEKIFDKNNEPVKQTSVTKHKIETGNHQPIKHRPYRVSPTERQAIQTEVDKMLDAGIIRHSESPWSSPVILVKKKDGNWRFCVDYRRLNKVTKKDVYPLPRIDDTLDSLKGAKFYSSMDLRSGYWQIEVDEADREKTAFITPDGLYEFLVMPFGLCNAPATFERMMDKILKGLKWTMALCYLDDIVVYSKSFNEHLHRLEIILQCLDKAELRLNPKKCLFGTKRIRVFGHLVDSKGIYPDPEKIEAIAKFPTPNSITDVRSFIGLCSYYRRFIENFAEKAAPLHEVLKKDNKFTWNSDQQDAFDFLKKALMSEPVLAYFEEQLPTELHTDASGYGIGAVLVQINDGKERPVGYASRTLSKAEKNYSTTERECLAAIWAINKFRPDLFGREFVIAIPPASSPFQRVGMDLLGRFPKSDTGNKWIIVCTDYLTRFAVTKALPTGEAKEAAKFLMEDVVLKHGAPREIITDRGRVFQSKLIAELTNQCSSIYRFTTAYHPQTNGLTERLNKTLANMIAMYVSVEQKDWDVILPYVTFAYNTAKQDTIGFTPFKLIHGREAETTVDTLFPNPHEDLQEDYSQKIASRVEETRQLARLETLKAQEKDKARYDSKHEAMDYNVGDLVWIFIPIRKVGLSEKLMKRYFGPYRVTRKLSDVTFEVEPVDQPTRRRQTRDLVHVLRMKPYHDPEDQADLFK
ncbi:hypothetical protein LAZ67_4001687 [Cordylochernes scorpioides]|uniref:Endonuclease n=1 Tax=Cordylochernes scorpioides TaxID=51811 RepID=A0ABY6KC55_9ARAC|nr:hypothetical protein LAZ67_4001687 [Cordylochernes scorpioides]